MLRQRGRMLPSLRRALLVLPFWAAAMLWMWSWWLSADVSRFMPLYVPLTFALLYEFAILPSIFLYFVTKARVPQRKIAQKGLKVAVISPCVPASESLDIVEKQLRAMSQIAYPHDSWILDEGNSKEIRALARKYGVKHFSRKDKPKYNQPTHPFQQKTKAGNINSWLNHVKRYKYDYFVQLDIDHIPQPNYLNKTLGYFRNNEVAWVQAPSVYGNLDSWTSRGAAEQELVLQGPLQMGFYGYSETPFIIGSHCTYRMSAIREIGGFQPTRAEDHLDTVYLAAKGYKGVFIPEIIATGDGPDTLNTYLAQQFAWAYSMFQVLLMHTPRMLKTMSRKRKWQFIFAQTWYPLWSLSYLIMFVTPLLALLAGRDVVSVDPYQMLIHFLPVYLGGYLVWASAKPVMQPRALTLSWRGIILHAVRWPVITRAILAAAFKIKKPYMITPKGSYAHLAPSLTTYRPFLLLALLSSSAVLASSMLRQGILPDAQVVFSITNSLFMLTICSLDLGLRLWQSRPRLADVRHYWVKPLTAVALTAVFVPAAITVPSFANAPQQLITYSASQTVAPPIAQPVNYSMTTAELTEQIALIGEYSEKEPKLGIYNALSPVARNKRSYIEHSFVNWEDPHYLAFALAKTVQAGNTPLITIEPRGESNGAKLLTEISKGVHDNRLKELAHILRSSKNPVYIRFAHEMELANLYSWGNQKPPVYIAAYRHVAKLFRAGEGQSVRFVWSPAGNHGAEAYYPGHKYVDTIGTTVLYDQYWYGHNRPTFEQLTAKRGWLLQFGKPVWIVEFGVGNTSQEYQRQIVKEALVTHEQLGYSKLIYLNMLDANIVGPDYRLHDVNDFGSFFEPGLRHK